MGLEGRPGRRRPHNKNFKTVWFNQWEPSTKRQHAHETYVSRFGDVDAYTNKDISTVIDKVPEHDLLVGGFPCQDYSVARNLSDAKGLVGKKGVLWWSIHGILVQQGKRSPNYLMLENVDRLLKSPVAQRGRDFAIMLSTLNSLGYMVEWRIINAAEYGMPQRRRRIFILGYKKGSPIHKRFLAEQDAEKWILGSGVIQKEFPASRKGEMKIVTLNKDAAEISTSFNRDKGADSPFLNGGVAIDHTVYTIGLKSEHDGPFSTLADILLEDKDVPDEFFIKKSDMKRWRYFKGPKNEPRSGKNGFTFTYTEGSVAFPDPTDKPSRTIVTGEGGSTPSRFKHVIRTKKGMRRLTPTELERLSMFPDNHTAGHSDTRRAFFIGNALVVGVVEKLGKALAFFHASNRKGSTALKSLATILARCRTTATSSSLTERVS